MAIHPLPSFYLEVAVFSPILINPMFINNVRYFLLKVIFNICTNLFITDIFLCTNFLFQKKTQNPISKHFTYLLIYLNYYKAISRAIESCETSGIEVSDHFREVTKMVPLGSGTHRNVIFYTSF